MSRQSPVPVSMGRNVRYVLTQGIRRGEPKAAIITRCWPDDAKSAVNLTVFPDLANDEGAEKFACSAPYDPTGKEPGTWHWPADAGDGFPTPPVAAEAAVLVCGVDCHPGDPNCNGYCTGKADHPPGSVTAVETPHPDTVRGFTSDPAAEAPQDTSEAAAEAPQFDPTAAVALPAPSTDLLSEPPAAEASVSTGNTPPADSSFSGSASDAGATPAAD